MYTEDTAGRVRAVLYRACVGALLVLIPLGLLFKVLTPS